jgi:hypothetical protein
MTLGQCFFWTVFGNNLSLVIAAGLLVTYGSLLLCARFPMTPVILLILIALPSTFLNHRHLTEVGDIAQGQVSTAELLPSDERCLAHDASVKTYALALYRLELPDIHHRRLDIAADQKPCGRYVIADITALVDCGGAELMGAEPRANWGLWKYPIQGCD